MGHFKYDLEVNTPRDRLVTYGGNESDGLHVVGLTRRLHVRPRLVEVTIGSDRRRSGDGTTG